MIDVTQLDYTKIKVQNLKGRYVTNSDIFPFVDNLSKDFLVETIGSSVLGNPVKMISWGTGKQKVLMWSQMHGNESTTTKAVVDLLNFLSIPSETVNFLHKECTFKIIPILSPDGAKAYTRVNANDIDLNRDAQDRTQPESNILKTIYDSFNPDFCFNLHDQRTIFNVGVSNKPATVSFLAPAFDVDRNISTSRSQSMKLIVAMNTVLQQLIPGQVGRYDDGFNANCVGDAFQMLNTPTILFESGHFPEDYQREKTREYVFYAILTAVHSIASESINTFNQEQYFEIPENGKQFFDVLIKNPHELDNKYDELTQVGVLFKEVLKNNTINFEPYITEVGVLKKYFGHKMYDCKNSKELNALKADNQLHSILV